MTETSKKPASSPKLAAKAQAAPPSYRRSTPRSRAASQAAQAVSGSSEEGKAALSWLHTARFLTTSAQLHQLPAHDFPEVAFVGRSNAGKSTCINTLCQQRQLAYASKTPGRTQHINMFSVGKQGTTDLILCDLPGYGYAAVDKLSKARWQQVMANYLVSRPQLKAVVMLADSRHGLTELDESLLDVIRSRVEAGLEFVVLLTKADKLNKTESAKALSIAKLQTAGGDVQLFSSLKRMGIEEAAMRLYAWRVPR
ncbi:MAG: ribosome biogenesis GTP-binding protein YihA/YsxC [Brachymonas sp.]